MLLTNSKLIPQTIYQGDFHPIKDEMVFQSINLRYFIGNYLLTFRRSNRWNRVTLNEWITRVYPSAWQPYPNKEMFKIQYYLIADNSVLLINIYERKAEEHLKSRTVA